MYITNEPYSHYLGSEIWKMRRSAYCQLKARRCELCQSDEQPLHLHHRNYDRLGQELDTDLILLCAECHFAIHDNVNFNRVSLEEAEDMLIKQLTEEAKTLDLLINDIGTFISK